MAYRFEYDSTNKILMCRFDGDVLFEALKRYYLIDTPRVIARTDFRGSIVDFTNVTLFDISPERIRELAAYPPVDPMASRLRIVVAATPHIFGLARMFELHGENTRPNLHVVSSMSQAYALLGVTNPSFKLIEEENPS